MADDGLFLANRPLLLDLNGQVARHLSDWLSREGMVECPARTAVDLRDQPYGSRYHAFPLPKLNYPPAPPIGINQLYWPTGASRHSRGYFLCTEDDAAFFRAMAYETTVVAGAKKHVPLTFLARLGGTTFTTELYVLAPRPLTSIVGSRLWLLPVVDARYWWAQTGIGSHPQRQPLLLEEDFELKSWQDIWDAIAAEIGPITVTQPSNRFKPDPWELTRQFESVAHFLDVCAHSCGLRVVRLPSGATKLVSAAESLTTRIANWSKQHAIIAGDTWQPYPMADRLQLMFQRLTEGALDRINQWWRVDMASKYYVTDAEITLIDEGGNLWAGATSPESAIGVTNCNEVLFTTFHANFDHTRPSIPTNQTDIETLAREIYKRHHEYALAQGIDVTFAGIQSWILTALEDYLLLDFGTEASPTTKLHSPQSPNSTGSTTPAALTHEYSRRVTTRVRSMPQEFGLRHVLCQTDQFLRVQEHEAWFKIVEFTPSGSGQSVKFLPPGGYAYARAVWLDGSNWIEHSSPLTLTVKLHDPLYLACGLKDEVLHATWSDERHRWEVDREHGLNRQVVVYSSSISVGGSGQVTLWTNNLETNPTVRVSAYLDWMATSPVVSGDKAIVKFWRDRKQWLITNAECG